MPKTECNFMNPKQSVNASEMACEKTTKTVEVFLRGGDS